MINEGFKMHGAMTATLKKGNGDIVVTQKDNIIVNVGFDFIADSIGKSTGRPASMSRIAIGSNGTAPSPTDVSMLSEITRAAATYSHVAGTKTFKFTARFPAGTGTGAIKEAGVINAASGGILLDRVTFGVINKGADDSLDIVFTFTMS